MLASRLLLAVFISLAAVGCTAKFTGGIGGDEFAVSKSMELAVLSGELAATEGYVEIYLNNDDMKEGLEELKNIDFSKPQQALIVDIPDNIGITFLSMQDEVQLGKMTNTVQEELNKRTAFSLPNMLASHAGSQGLAFSSVLSTSAAYQQQSGFKNCYVLLDYGDQYICMATLYALPNETVSASNFIIKLDESDRDLLDADKINELLGKGIPFGLQMKYRVMENEELEKLL